MNDIWSNYEYNKSVYTLWKTIYSNNIYPKVEIYTTVGGHYFFFKWLPFSFSSKVVNLEMMHGYPLNMPISTNFLQLVSGLFKKSFAPLSKIQTHMCT